MSKGIELDKALEKRVLNTLEDLLNKHEEKKNQIRECRNKIESYRVLVKKGETEIMEIDNKITVALSGSVNPANLATKKNGLEIEIKNYHEWISQLDIRTQKLEQELIPIADKLTAAYFKEELQVCNEYKIKFQSLMDSALTLLVEWEHTRDALRKRVGVGGDLDSDHINKLLKADRHQIINILTRLDTETFLAPVYYNFGATSYIPKAH